MPAAQIPAPKRNPDGEARTSIRVPRPTPAAAETPYGWHDAAGYGPDARSSRQRVRSKNCSRYGRSAQKPISQWRPPARSDASSASAKAAGPVPDRQAHRQVGTLKPRVRQGRFSDLAAQGFAHSKQP